MFVLFFLQICALNITKVYYFRIFFMNLSTGEFGLIRNAEDQYIRDTGYKQHAFNALVSNNIGLFRKLPDTRHKV